MRTTASTEEFERRGLVTVRGLVPRDLVDEVVASFGADRPRRVLDAWRTNAAVRRLACAPTVLELLAELYRRRPIPFQTLDFAHGTEQRLHADTIHFDSLPSGLMCGVWVALETVGAEQGPVQYVPGSHRLPAVGADEARDATGRFDYRRYEDLVASRVAGMPVEQFHGAAGDAVVWQAGLVHGGAPTSLRGSTRWSQATHYFFDGACYITPMLSDPTRAEYRMRFPLVDISTGRPVRQTVDGGPARMVHLRGGGTRLLGAGDPRPRAATRAASALRARARIAAWHAAPAVDRLRRSRAAEDHR